MCNFRRQQQPSIAAQTVAVPDNAEATRRGTIEAVRRRARAGAAANILTGSLGLAPDGSVNTQLGGAAQ